jgi:endonuclease/exonuclease/phosphatase family metal-dependent hydrolase
VLDYPLPGRIPGRGALWVRYGSGDKAIVVIVAHLSLGREARRRQFAFLAELIGRQPHTVLMGDLNCGLHSEELRFLFQQTTLKPPAAPAPSTYPSWRPRRAIDHILTTPDLAVEKLWTLEHAVSDHLPVAALVRVPASMAPR